MAGPRPLFSWAAVLVCVVLARPAAASWSDAPGLDALACEADTIVWGNVSSVELPTSPSVPWRETHIAVRRTLKGEAAEQIVDRSAAGLHGAHPDYRTGEEVVSFLARPPDAAYYRTLHRSQGKLLVRDGVVQRVQLPIAEFLERLAEAVRACPAPDDEATTLPRG